MQRFKRFAMKHGNVNKHGDPVVFGRGYGFAAGHPAANARTGKFIYGVGLGKAARHRADEITALSLITCAQDRSAAGMVQYYGTAARLAGWRLP